MMLHVHVEMSMAMSRCRCQCRLAFASGHTVSLSLALYVYVYCIGVHVCVFNLVAKLTMRHDNTPSTWTAAQLGSDAGGQAGRLGGPSSPFAAARCAVSVLQLNRAMSLAAHCQH